MGAMGRRQFQHQVRHRVAVGGAAGCTRREVLRTIPKKGPRAGPGVVPTRLLAFRAAWGVVGAPGGAETWGAYGFTDLWGKPDGRGRGSHASANQVTAGQK